MTLTSLALYVLLLGVVGPILVAALIVYLAPKGRVLQYAWQKIKFGAIGFLGGAVALVIIKLLDGHDLYEALTTTWPYFMTPITIYPLTWLIITYVHNKFTENGPAKA